MSVVIREFPAPLSHLINPQSSLEDNPTLKEITSKLSSKQRDQTPQGRKRVQPGPSCPALFRLELRGDAISLPVPGWRELELGTEDVTHIGKGINN